MPAKSKAQANLMRAAEHGASFPKAQQVRNSMTLQQIGDFARTPSKSLPKHVGHPHKNLGKYLHKAKGT